ncbi:hypothetical protein [Fluviispira multicolorata]|uniref:Uncharacterized protein n=1 Tax=Fluviispira multicolorata TaxID=2654512 RepID=A0A833JH32_9BACT|nr:hypothetical protein [Fluviispira multicolorata]KAB8033182.1 hypothetical protein GCL57_00360 [Fluviispira multicolorata]
MKQVFLVFFCLSLSICFSLGYAQSSNLSLDTCDTALADNVTCSPNSVAVYASGSSTASFTPPLSAKSNISKLVLTYSVKLYDPTGNSFNYSDQNWGVRFVDSSGNNPVDYYPASANNAPVTMDIDASQIRTRSNIYVGTVILTLYFTDSSLGNTLPTSIANLIDQTNNALSIIPIYSSTINTNLKFYWQADKGAMLYAPTISVNSQDSAFVVTLKPPTNLAAANVNSAGTNLTSVNANTLSGYIIVYWLDSDSSGQASGCKASPGNWQFYLNPISINNSAQNTSSTCTYTNYNISMKGGGVSAALSCTTTASILTFDSTLSGVTNLTADTAAIPFSFSTPSDFASDSNGSPIGCYKVVYVPSSRSTWSKGYINNGEIYGVMAWALNSGYDTVNKVNSPKYSLSHSEISYVSPAKFPLASSEKTPSLPQSQSDCFFVTAASGNANSQAVFYWRVLRDEYLTPIGITPYYYAHAKKWAVWLDNHPRLKPATNFILEYSGKTIYHATGFVKNITENLKTFFSGFKKLLIQEAGAQELTGEKKNNSNEFQQPNYELFITGGILLPTGDKYLYDKYYSSQSTIHFELGASQVFWLNNFGFSVGLLGRYLTNSSDDSVVTNTGVTQDFTRSIYAAMGEAIFAVRYRNPSFLYFQPGVFAGVGMMRLREEAKSGTAPQANDGTNQTSGITVWSPIYEFGANLDISLTTLASVSPWELGTLLNDVLLRTSVSYNLNPSPAISTTGIFVQAGFVFLLN